MGYWSDTVNAGGYLAVTRVRRDSKLVLLHRGNAFTQRFKFRYLFVVGFCELAGQFIHPFFLSLRGSSIKAIWSNKRKL